MCVEQAEDLGRQLRLRRQFQYPVQSGDVLPGAFGARESVGAGAIEVRESLDQHTLPFFLRHRHVGEKKGVEFPETERLVVRDAGGVAGTKEEQADIVVEDGAAAV